MTCKFQPRNNVNGLCELTTAAAVVGRDGIPEPLGSGTTYQHNLVLNAAVVQNLERLCSHLSSSEHFEVEANPPPVL